MTNNGTDNEMIRRKVLNSASPNIRASSGAVANINPTANSDSPIPNPSANRSVPVDCPRSPRAS